jgi:hypothetical protein
MGTVITAGMAAIALSLAACQSKTGSSTAPPPRATDRAPVPSETSVITVPVDANTTELRHAIEQAVPRTLWTINKPEPRCIPPQRVHVLGARIPVTPRISCTIVGEVTRGTVRLRGEGREFVVDMPINARISARDVGGILKGETATGSATVQARITLDVRPDWTTRGTVRLRYNWTRAPGIDFLGQRITFTDQADEKLAPVVRNLEASVQRELNKLNLRGQAEQLWRQAFTSVLVNERNPPVWMRVTPHRLTYDGYELHEGRIRLNLGIEALTETFVGDRPADPAVTPLPRLERSGAPHRLQFFIPVLADYAQLEPVLMRALARRAARPFDVPGLRPLMARFDRVQMYGTTGGRIAVGLTLTAWPQPEPNDRTSGLIWITARPVNAPGSTQVRFEDLQVAGDTDGVRGDILLQLGRSPGLSELLADELTQNFAGDVDSLIGKIHSAVDHRQAGDFSIQTQASDFETGQIQAFGNGLYMPVRVIGSARIAYRPSRASR